MRYSCKTCRTVDLACISISRELTEILVIGPHPPFFWGEAQEFAFLICISGDVGTICPGTELGERLIQHIVDPQLTFTAIPQSPRYALKGRMRKYGGVLTRIQLTESCKPCTRLVIGTAQCNNECLLLFISFTCFAGRCFTRAHHLI